MPAEGGGPHEVRFGQAARQHFVVEFAASPVIPRMDGPAIAPFIRPVREDG